MYDTDTNDYVLYVLENKNSLDQVQTRWQV